MLRANTNQGDWFMTGFICKSSLIFFLIMLFFHLLCGTEMVKPNPKGKGGLMASNPSELRL